MVLKRIIPCLLYDGSGLVKTVKFKNPNYIGDPINAIRIFNEKEVDELIILDINASKQKRSLDFKKIEDMASEAFMPFTYGGGVKTFEDFKILYKLGVEKVVVNSLIQENPGIIKNVIKEFGSQAVVACIDYKKNLMGKLKPFSYLGNKINYSISEYANYLANEIGVGEIMIYNAERDGTWEGFDIKTTSEISNTISIPIITAGGCGHINDIKKVFSETHANAVAIGSMAVYSKKGMGVLINFPNRELVVTD
ncbi:MAG: HisA/HisF-related TIM barrel protein [Bacteroidota bacterium]|nr:HisA/HisF-related TIM barrel protein [Bacteroidota bacterium]